MINLPNTIKLANTKFQSRRWSALFSGCTVAIGAVLILISFIIGSGITGIADKYLRDPFYGKFIYTLSRVNKADQTDLDRLTQLQTDSTANPINALKNKSEIDSLTSKIVNIQSTHVKLDVPQLQSDFAKFNPKSIKESIYYSSKYVTSSLSSLASNSPFSSSTNSNLKTTPVAESEVVLGFGLSGLYPDTTKVRQLSSSITSQFGLGTSSASDTFAKEKFTTPIDLTALPDWDLVSDILPDTKVDNNADYLPVIIPIERVFEREFDSEYQDSIANGSIDQQQYNTKLLEAAKKYIGQTYELTTLKKVFQPDTSGKATEQFKYVETKTGVKAKIVGFRKSQTLFGINISRETSISRNNMITTLTNLQKYPALQSLLSTEMTATPQYVFEFSKQSDGYAFYKDTTGTDLSLSPFNFSGRLGSIDAFKQKQKTMTYTDTIDQNQSVYEIFNSLITFSINIAIYIGAFLLIISAIFIFMTVSKLISDSRKEIGVFRSFGATRNDIRLVYYCYTVILSAFGFVLGLIASYFLAYLTSFAASSQVFDQVIPLTRTLKQVDTTSLVGYPYMTIFYVFLVIILVGLIASFFPVWRGSRIDPIKALRDE